MAKVRSYSKVLIFRSEYKIGQWYEYELVEETIRKHQANVRRIRDLIPKDIGDHLLLSGGGCVYCKECAYVKREPCRHPDIAIPPIEAYGVDIFRFTKKNNIKYGSPEGEMYYFGMILFN
jgi:predicted metal-binding protein